MTRRRRKKFYSLILAILTCIGIYVSCIQPYPPHPPPGAGDSPLALRLLDVREWHWPTQEYECVPYIVQWDDHSIWTIAAKLYPGQHTGRMVWAIRRASKLEGPDGPVIRPGQVLWIPDPALYGVGRKQKMQLAVGE
ncbi:MAG: LysM peptidoglycan-binding domain-containing protein [Firmicutes bacterium]|nr:LysM peptidoglycan-binding domain-containing protein [Bacillota bacterium]